VETVEDGDAAAAARRLLRGLRINGLVEVEFKRDARDGLPKLLDINARVWGWHTLCARAGVDFPWLHWELVHGRAPRPVKARPGVRWMRMSTDLPTAAREVLSGRLPLGRYLASFRPPATGAIFAADDPWPAATDLPFLALLALRRRRAAETSHAPPLPEAEPVRALARAS
jgi:predicted ATP-grasp superfamily ATP-dependent carboligase